MRHQDETRLAAHVLQYKAAQALQCLSLVAGVLGALWHGVPALVAGVLGAWIFGLAKPAPDDDLDRQTGRK